MRRVLKTTIGSLFLAVTCWAIVSFSGCGGSGGGPERVVVSGIVTYSGKPISEGAIRFVPDQASTVPIAGAPIINGKYTVISHGGVPVGTHRVQIEAFRKVAFSPKPGQVSPRYASEGGMPEQYIPDCYNTNTELEVAIEPGSGKITMNFDLKEKT